MNCSSSFLQTNMHFWIHLLKMKLSRVLRAVLHSDGTYHKHFCDYTRIVASGGQGGSGVSLFLHLYRSEFAGPSGGDGGNGGHVIFQASHDVRCFFSMPKTLKGAFYSGLFSGFNRRFLYPLIGLHKVQKLEVDSLGILPDFQFQGPWVEEGRLAFGGKTNC